MDLTARTGILAMILAFACVATSLPNQSYSKNSSQGVDDHDCRNINIRRSWNVFSDEEKKAYIDAELCLMSSPPRSGVPGARNRFDELQYNHIVQASVIHFVGAILPWHRYFVKVHEDLLRTECGYTGTQPYWDELSDLEDYPNIQVFDPNTGFGGNGTDENGCIVDGPFKNHTLHFGPNGSQDYCISRHFDPAWMALTGESHVEACSSQDAFINAWPCYEADPHRGGHGAVGGVMANVSNSPGDPMFYLHHAYVDKLWWEWQQQDLPARFTAMGGARLPSAETLAFLDSSLVPLSSLISYDGDGTANETTLHHNLWMRDIRPNVTIADVMN